MADEDDDGGEQDDRYKQILAAWGAGSQFASKDEIEIRLEASRRRVALRMRYWRPEIILTVVAVILAVLAFRRDKDSFAQHYLVELSCGAVLFLVVPIIVRGARRSWKTTISLGAFIAGGTAFIGWLYDGPVRLFAIEVSVGTVLAIGLEAYIRDLMERDFKALEDALAGLRRDLEEGVKRVRDWEL